LEASALTTASRRGLLVRRSPLLKLQGDEGLVSLVRSGNPGAFETIVDRYQGRLLGFCRQMLHSTEDAEDVLQEVFVNAYKAMLADSRDINLRPWLYRIARNRCLNQLRKPTADAQETMDMVPEVDAASTHERAHNREEFRQLLRDVNKLPETQRSALLLREMDAMSYEDIAQTMETTVPSVKSLLVRARISLAEASQSRQLTCGEVRLELAEAAEGLRKVSGPIRRHVRECGECADFRSQVRSDSKALAALVPVGPLLALKGFLASKLGIGGGGVAGGGAASGGAGSGITAAGSAGAFGAGGAAASGAAGGIGAVGSALGAKAVAGVVTAAVITAGAVEVRNQVVTHDPASTASLAPAKLARAHQPAAAHRRQTIAAPPVAAPPVSAPPVAATDPVPPPTTTEPAPAGDSATPATDGSATAPIAPAEEATTGDPNAGASSTGTVVTTTTTGTGGDTAVVTIGDTDSPGTGSGAGVDIVTPPLPPPTPDDPVGAPPLGG
jgi:RNA polymerase sigma factor (sigma-70 family)